MFKIVRYERARILDWGDLVGKTSKTVDDPDLLARRSKGSFKARLRDLTGREAMIGYNGRSLCQHERKLRVEDRLAIESAVLPDGGFARAKTILAAYEERQVAFELALISREKTNQAPEMIIMSMASTKASISAVLSWRTEMLLLIVSGM